MEGERERQKEREGERKRKRKRENELGANLMLCAEFLIVMLMPLLCHASRTPIATSHSFTVSNRESLAIAVVADFHRSLATLASSRFAL
jgi:hypothetical protein